MAAAAAAAAAESEGLEAWLAGLPKAELHIHVEGTLEAEDMIRAAARNGVHLPYNSPEELKVAYERFGSLADFLELYYAGIESLRTVEDYYTLAFNYLSRAHADGVVHAEVMFDPQAHISRGVEFDVVMAGLTRAQTEAESRLGITSGLIMSFLRDRPAAEALSVLDLARPYKEHITAVGLDSAEIGHPPSNFQQVFARAKAEGYFRVAHAGEEGPSDNVRDSLDMLDVARIDHGYRALDDPHLVARLARDRIPITVCPLSSIALRAVKDPREHPLRDMLDSGLVATMNSDDPAYFGGYVNANFMYMHEHVRLTREEICTMARNSFEASFLSERRKEELIEQLDNYQAATRLD